jgi:hypothetical protein
MNRKVIGLHLSAPMGLGFDLFSRRFGRHLQALEQIVPGPAPNQWRVDAKALASLPGPTRESIGNSPILKQPNLDMLDVGSEQFFQPARFREHCARQNAYFQSIPRNLLLIYGFNACSPESLCFSSCLRG